MHRIKFRVHKGTVGSLAYKVSKTFRLGFHLFKNGNDIIFRFVYLRTKDYSYYIEIAYKYRDIYETQKEI